MLQKIWGLRGEQDYRNVDSKFFMLASKAIGMVVKVDDVEALQKDLQKDFVMNSTLSSVAGNTDLKFRWTAT